MLAKQVQGLTYDFLVDLQYLCTPPMAWTDDEAHASATNRLATKSIAISMRQSYETLQKDHPGRSELISHALVRLN